MESRPVLRWILACALLAAPPLAAQQPPKLEPLPEFAPPPPGSADRPDEPGVQIKSGGKQQVEEKVIDGRRVAHVTTSAGEEYYLIEDLGDGPGLRNESLDRGIRVPLWVIRRF
jgi:DNA-binding transcriptional LysR family regulator